MRIYIELKRDANPHKVLNNLFKHTPMQLAFNMNMLALVDGQPQTLPLKSVLQHYVDHRREIVRRRTDFDLRKARDRAHILEGLKKALDNLDAVIKTIRESADTEAARNNLMSRFELSELQAQAILDMRLARLAALERQKIEDEYLEVIQLIAELEDILANPARVLSIIKDELTELKRKYAGQRRTRVAGRRQPRDDRRGPDRRRGRRDHDLRPRLHQAPAGRDLPPPGARRARASSATSPARRTPSSTSSWPTPTTGRSSSPIAAASSARRSTPSPTPAGRRRASRSSTSPGVQVETGEVPMATITLPDFKAGSYLVLATRNGIVKKTPLEQFERVRSTGIRAITIDEKDELAWVDISSGHDDVIIATALGKIARFDEADVRAMGRDAAGVIGIRLAKAGDYVVGMSVVQPEADLLVLTATGYGKRVPLVRVPDAWAAGRRASG